MITHASYHEIPLLREYWKQTFGDGELFLDSLLSAYPPEQHCLVSKTENGELTGFLFLLPAQIFHSGTWSEARYLYGVCTLPQFRRQGVFRQLFTTAAEEAKRDGAHAVFSLPSDDRSRAAHTKLGFLPVYAQKTADFHSDDIERLRRLRMASMPLKQLSAAEFNFVSTARPTELRTRLIGDFASADFLASDGLYLGNTRGYASVKRRGKRLIVKETDLDPFELAYALARLFPSEELTICLPPHAETNDLDCANIQTVETAMLFPLTFTVKGHPLAFTAQLLED